MNKNNVILTYSEGVRTRRLEDFRICQNYLADPEKNEEEFQSLLVKACGCARSRLKTNHGHVLDSLDIEDIIADASCKAVQILPKFDGHSRFVSFFMGITRYKVQEFFNKNMKHKTSKVQYIENWHNNMESINPIENWEGSQYAKTLLKALSPNDSHIVYQKVIHKKSGAELARELKMYPYTVNRRYRRALKELRERIKPENYEIISLEKYKKKRNKMAQAS